MAENSIERFKEIMPELERVRAAILQDPPLSSHDQAWVAMFIASFFVGVTASISGQKYADILNLIHSALSGSQKWKMI